MKKNSRLSSLKKKKLKLKTGLRKVSNGLKATLKLMLMLLMERRKKSKLSSTQ